MDDSPSDGHLPRKRYPIAFPNEIIHEIFKWLDPTDITNLACSCKTLSNNINSDGQLFKAVYFQILDVRHADPLRNIDYRGSMKSLVRFRHIFSSPNFEVAIAMSSIEYRTNILLFVESFVTHLLRTASDASHSKNLSLLKIHTTSSQDATIMLEALLTQSKTCIRADPICSDSLLNSGASWMSPSGCQASARLHVLHGKPFLMEGDRLARTPFPYASSMVFDLRNYTEENLWGPYIDRLATADWEKLEAIMVVLCHHAEDINDRIDRRMFPKGIMPEEGWEGAHPYSYKSVNLRGLDYDDDEEEDGQAEFRDVAESPANCMIRITSLGRGSEELLEYNLALPLLPNDEPRPAPQYVQMTYLFLMELQATRGESMDTNDGQSYQIIYFEGVSRSVNSERNPNAPCNIEGSVRRTEEGEVRWETTSIFDGQWRLRSEGIQIGGIQSARGVLGHWFIKERNQHSGVGPITFYKVSDQIKERVPLVEEVDSSEKEGETSDLDTDDDIDDGDDGDDSDDGEEVEEEEKEEIGGCQHQAATGNSVDTMTAIERYF
ncbi:uncharacterized protein RAG0_03960 [Rhynchosporium agropyri]|uniref:F-box domain-containing protein n=1 Tax=Rhynchosporium agropyri TaxID=914238 RepID=A0A1E1K725_9HELO|nr:uncharacterized protein RAG0_03960 [Rhynchosporium agropyri]